jgi:signal transduction histidine kinase
VLRTVRNQFIVSEERFSRVLVSFMVLGFAALVVAGIAAAWVTGQNQDHSRWVSHTYEVEVAVANAQRLVEQGEASRRGYLLTADPTYRAAYGRAQAALGPALNRISALTGDNPRQSANMIALRRSIGALLTQRGRTIRLVDAGQTPAADALFAKETSVRRLTAIRQRFTGMADEERRLLTIRDEAQQLSIRAFYAILSIAAVLLLLVALASFTTVRRYTANLTASRDRLRSFNERLEASVAERTADLSRANEEIQRFAYIVSHDLRSPLVNVMGFTAELEAATAPLAELVGLAEAQCPAIVTDEARLAAREDLPEAIGFIRTSTQKMDRLINAILKLSREGRRVITPEAMPTDAIVEAIAGSMQHVLDDRGVTLTIARPLPTLTTDRVALEQILSNLIENATKYLQPGRAGAIHVSGEETRGRVILAVTDNGRGIDPRDHERIFDLFRRSGQQDQPGEGIGLAHVRALAYRLGGTINVESQLGEGSTFRVNLPKQFEVQEKRS